jgi:hypothetical protein
MDREVVMYEDRRRSPGQWAPWIEDPDPPMEPMTREQSKAAAAAAKAYMDAHPEPAPLSTSPPTKTSDQIREELISELMQDKQFTREKAEKHLDGFL